jgi:hypothetical protein
MNYTQYLQSNKWTKKKNQVFGLHLRRCAICKKKNVDVHHKTYKDLGSENQEYHLIPLCRFHHFEIHNYSKENKINLYQATEQYIKKHKIKEERKWNNMTPLEVKRYLGKGL